MADMTRLPSVSQHSRQQPSSPRHSRNNSQCLWEIHSGHLHRWERTKKQSPEKAGQCLCTHSFPWDYRLHEAKPSLLPTGFSKAQCPYPWSRSGQQRGQGGGEEMLNQLFSLLAELFDLDIAFLRITEILIK